MSLPELVELETVIERFGDDARATVLTRVEGFPVWALEIGEGRPEDPCLLLVGGVHGLERIGTKVVLAYLGSLAERLAWDALTREALTRSRIVSIPLLNPVGMRNGTRGNGNGVDLMRNGPSSDALGGTFLVGGQRLSPRLPWFMGDPNEMEPEAVALIDFVERVVLSSRSAISLDVHSGFGFQDRIWFPYARKAGPIAHTPEVYCLSALLDTTLPHHIYTVEPQASAYTIQGDLWDHLYDQSRARQTGIFLPLTLEMGSWTWVRKDLRQLFSLPGAFNPFKRHRVSRTLRRHLLLIDFLHRAAVGFERWIPTDRHVRERCLSLASDLWFT